MSNNHKKRRPLPLPQLNTGEKPNDYSNGVAIDLDNSSISERWWNALDNQHPFVKNHQVNGQAVLPGMAYIEIIYQWLLDKAWTPEQVELHNLVILNPLILADEKKVCLQIVANSSSLPMRLTVKAVAVTSIGNPGVNIRSESEELLLAQVDLCCSSSAEIFTIGLIDLDSVMGEAPASMDDFYIKCVSEGLVHTGFMRAKGAVNYGNDSVWIQVNLAESNQGDSYLIHPVLLDACGVAIAPSLLRCAGIDNALFLPLAFGQIYLKRPLLEACYARVALAGISCHGELLRCTIEIFDSYGEPVAILKNFTCKLVRENISSVNGHGNIACSGSNKESHILPDMRPQAESLEILLTSIVATAIGKAGSSIDINEGYYALGLDSSALLTVVDILEKELKLTLSPTLLFEFPNIAALILHLKSEYPSLNKDLIGQAIDVTPANIHDQGEIDEKHTSYSAIYPGTQEAIAIIGVAGRFPQANTIYEFWENLKAGRDCITEVPSRRWDWHKLESVTTPSGKPISRWGGFLDDVDCFDSLFFKISPREAESMDPQERLFLEICWEAIENAGYTPENLLPVDAARNLRPIGVFAGLMHKDYAFVGADAVLRGHEDTPLSLNYASIPNRVSYCFNFNGPSIAVDTVCSASLTALHYAVQSIRTGDSKIALAGGVNLSLHPNKYISYGKMGLHSSDGYCRTFGKGGDGYVSAEAVGAVLLKPLAEAQQDKDYIYAIVKGSSVNHVGRVSGITVPSPVAQADMIIDCLKKSGVDARSISYLETHGTGTSLGDPIEIQGLRKVFGNVTGDYRCAIGSVKSNMGHAEAAAGITGLIKTILQLQHRVLVPSLHCETVNPYLNIEASPFYIQYQCGEWIYEGGPRRCGVSSFGATGSNAFVLLEEAVDMHTVIASTLSEPVFLPISAKGQDRLKQYAHRLCLHLASNPTIDLPSLAFTLQQGRRALSTRLVVVAKSVGDFIENLQSFIDGRSAKESMFIGEAGTSSHSASTAVDKWVLEKNWSELANSWCQGIDIHWAQYNCLAFGDRDPLTHPLKRVPLVSYPFERERYWIQGAGEPLLPGSLNSDSITRVKTENHNILLAPVWQEIPVSALGKSDADFISPDMIVFIRNTLVDKHKLFKSAAVKAISLDESVAELAQLLRQQNLVRQIIFVADESDMEFPQGLLESQYQLAGFAFRLVKACLSLGYAAAPINLTVITRDAFAVNKAGQPNPAHASLHGLFGVVAKEVPAWNVKILDLEAGGDFPFLHRLHAIDKEENTIAYRSGGWYKQILARCHSERAAEQEVFSPQGVYVIIGGAGGIGAAISEYALKHCQAQFVWVGRKQQSPDINAKLTALGQLGPKPFYISADATDLPDMQRAAYEIRARFGKINGIIHSALGELDHSIEHMNEEAFFSCCRSKVDICVRLAQVFHKDKLDFVLFFSSINSFARDHGKSGYATGNLFEDGFAKKLSQLWSCKVKVVNWGWWGELGISANVPEAFKRRMQHMGFAGITVESAMDTLRFLLASPLDQLALVSVTDADNPYIPKVAELVIKGDQISPPVFFTRGVTGLAAQANEIKSPQPFVKLTQNFDDRQSIHDQAVSYFIDVFAATTKLAPAKINPHEPMESYGIDSILIVQMNNLLGQHLDEVSTTLFFEHQTIDALVTHFISTQRENINKLLGLDSNAAVADNSAADQAVPPPANLPSPGIWQNISDEPIAIIGMHGRFPMANNLHEFWQNLVAGKDCILPVPDDRGFDNFYEADVELAIQTGKSYINCGGFIEGFADFDAELFNIIPNVADCMDPQERWFIQSCWLLLEDAGYTSQALNASGRVGVFAGITKNGFEYYLPELFARNKNLLPHTSFSSVANQVSYLFDFTGPSMPIDTMCSASLTAIHQACEHIKRGECEVAIAGGVNLYLHPYNFAYLCKARMLSSEGKCKSFSQDANGFVPAEGVGSLLLKRLSQAQRDKDNIRALIISSGINHGGKTNGYTVPNPKAQQALIASAMEKANIDPRTISYIEAHGTGTKLGDPIEFKALAGAFRQRAQQLDVALENGFCAIGSVKSNCGHLESAAGMASLCKVVLQMEHGILVPSIHAKEVNSEIHFKESCFTLQQELAQWKRPLLERDGQVQEYPFRAVISSFGAGGSNAHIIVEEYRKTPQYNVKPARETLPGLIVLSAKTPNQLVIQAENLLDFITLDPASNPGLPSIAYTLQKGRMAMEYRLAIIAETLAQLSEKLSAFLRGDSASLAGVFTGNSSVLQQEIPALLADDDLALTQDAWIAKRKYYRLLDAWCKGMDINWEKLYGQGNAPQKVSLPAYPLAKNRYWIIDSLKDSRQEHLSLDYFQQNDSTTSLYIPEWKEVISGGVKTQQPDDGQWHLWIVKANEQQFSIEPLLTTELIELQVFSYNLNDNDLAGEYENLAQHLLQKVQPLLKSACPAFIQLVVLDTGELNSCFSGLGALLHSAAEEHSYIKTQCIRVSMDITNLSVLLADCRAYPGFPDIDSDNSGVRVLQLSAHTTSIGTTDAPWQSNGVYLITGGLGALGCLFAKDILQHCPHAKIILLGRATRAQQDLPDALTSLGDLDYYSVDIADRLALARVIGIIRQKYQRITGVLHCAGIVEDSYLVNKTSMNLARVFSPKVRGLVNLDDLVAPLAPDFFVCCSSIASLGNIAQGDYAAANAFMDQYIESRMQQMKSSGGERKYFSINWSYWEAGGIKLDQQGREKLSLLGMRGLPSTDGLKVLHHALLQINTSQCFVFHGDSEKIRAAIARRFGAGFISGQKKPDQEKSTIVGLEDLDVKVESQLKRLFAAVTGLGEQSIDVNRPLESYGIDSIIVTAMNKKLESSFPRLSKTLFFQHRTLGSIAKYLLSEFSTASLNWVASQSAVLTSAVGSHRETAAAAVATPSFSREQKINKNTEHFNKIAVIGLAGKYPNAKNLDEFWENLVAGKESISEIPQQRWPLEGFYEPDVDKAINESKSYSKWGGFLTDFAEFDALLFGISPREAMILDPQERLFMQCCWHVIEDAGYTKQSLNARHQNKVGVFVGITKAGFDLHGPDLWQQGDMLFPYTSFSSVANRVSYFFDFQGPSIPFDTMCSSSLVAIHHAIESLRRKECQIAIAGGVNLYLHPATYVGLCAQKMLSTDAHCKSFGAGGDGFVPGEGVGAVLLKPLELAQDDNDPIHAVLLASGINHGGRTYGYTVPSPVAQAALIAEVLKRADRNPRDIHYIEAHGTGTALGDPIEIEGLTQAFCQLTGETSFSEQYCAVGSLKSNIGHLESAAGIAGLTKVILQMRNNILVPTLNAQTINPNIDFLGSPFKLQTSLVQWQGSKGHPMLSGVSSFGAGGVNAHILVEQFLPAVPLDSVSPKPALPLVLPLSATSLEQLQQYGKNLSEFIVRRKFTNRDLPHIAYTLQTGRETMARKIALVATDIDDLYSKLQQLAGGKLTPDSYFSVRGGSHVERQEIGVGRQRLSARTRDLLKAWLDDEPVNWFDLYDVADASLLRRMHLPGYAFRQDKYWIYEKLTGKGAFYNRDQNSTQANAKAKLDVSLSRPGAHAFTESLVENPLPLGNYSGHKHLICFAQGEELQDAFRQSYADSSTSVKLAFVTAAQYTCSAVDNCKVISPDSIANMLAGFNSDSHSGLDIVFAWPLESPDDSKDINLFLTLFKAIKQANLQSVRLCLLFAVDSLVTLDNQTRCYAEGWEGVARSLALIAPGFQFCTIQYHCHGPMRDWDFVANSTARELAQRQVSSVNYIHETRLTNQIHEIEIQRGPQVIKNGGVYIITGGAGALGQIFAGFLLNKYQAKVAIIGRSPENKVKPGLLSLLKNDQAFGYYEADVTDINALSIAVDQITRSFGPINGVIHAAGLLQEKNLFDIDEASFKQVLAPKLEGSIVLEKIFADKDLDFICHISSSAAVLGDFGSGSYAMANRFQSCFATQLNTPINLTKRISIQWPIWREGGMGRAESIRTHLYLKGSGQLALEKEAGLEIFEHLLAAQSGQVMVLYGNSEQLKEIVRVKSRANQAIASDSTPPSPHSSVNEDGDVLLEIKICLGNLLEIPLEDIISSTHFVDLGCNSIFIARFAQDISKRLAREISPALLFNYSTPALLANYIIESTQGQQRLDPYGKSDSHLEISNRDIAVIAMSGRFPNARNVDEMWSILHSGKSAIAQISVDRFCVDEHYNAENEEGKTCCKWLGMIPGAAEFDPLFFEISPLEAVVIDPRQRILLQESWLALEHAGYGANACRESKIGVFVGVEPGDYQRLIRPADGQVNSLTSNHDAILASRISYCLDLNGPVMAINTACSSGLVAAHQACLSLRAGECDAALVTSANMLLSPDSLIAMSQAGMLSPTGRCRTFDAMADGIVPGEAAVAIVLKSLARAENDKDPILAVINGSGINYDGKTNGLTAPSGRAQAQLIKQVYKANNILAGDVEYVIAHGTGTKLGDPVEVNALNEAFRATTNRQGYCALGSTKPNFGHTFAASGLVSLVSLIQAFRHQAIPASINCEKVNSFADWHSSPFFVNAEIKDWPRRESPRMGAVSAFGMSGTNVHMVLSSYDREVLLPDLTLPPYFFLPLSAKNDDALRQKLKDLYAYLGTQPMDSSSMLRLSYTLITGRHHFRHRFGMVVDGCREATQVLAETLMRLDSEAPVVKTRFGKVNREFTENKTISSQAEQNMQGIALIRREQINEKINYQQTFVSFLELYAQGYDLDWRHYFGPQPLPKIFAPGYPFTRETYWVNTTAEAGKSHAHGAVSDIVEKNMLADPLYLELLRAARLHEQIALPKAGSTNNFDAVDFSSLLEDIKQGSLSVEQAIGLTLESMNS